MKQTVILDTGPIVALLNPFDTQHKWVLAQMSEIEPPFITCEPVITEACFLAEKYGRGADAILELLENGFMFVGNSLDVEVKAVRQLMRKYADVPMSLADACLVRMLELHPGSPLITLDNDFKIYRIHRNQFIDIIIP